MKSQEELQALTNTLLDYIDNLTDDDAAKISITSCVLDILYTTLLPDEVRTKFKEDFVKKFMEHI